MLSIIYTTNYFAKANKINKDLKTLFPSKDDS